MEMQQEFSSVSNTIASASALELSSSTPPSPSSLTSSPENSSSISSLSILSPPHRLELQAQPDHSVSIPSTPAIQSACPTLPRYLTKEEAWKSLRRSIPHSMKLAQLQSSEGGFQKDVSSHKKAARRLSKDLYLIVSMYALLQGVIFAAVAQSNIFTCEDRWGPAGVVIAITLGTVIAVLDKLRRMGYEKQEVKKFETRQSAVWDKIALLQCKGSFCEIETLEPAHAEVFNDEPLCIFSAHGLLVLGFLLGFSALMLASCKYMLCPPCRCHR